MSHHIYFCSSSERRVTVEELRKVFQSLEYVRIIDLENDKFQAVYENPQTDVYATFDYDPEDEESAEEVGVPPGFRDIHLYFLLNYVRPSFFGRESIPLVERVALGLGVQVVDPQDDAIGGSGQVKECRPGELIQSWRTNNEWAIRTLEQDRKEGKSELDPFLHLPLEKSMYWWNYTRNQEKFQRELGDDTFAPTLLLLKKAKERTVRTAYIWTEGIPQVFPVADFVLLQNLKKNWRGQSIKKKLLCLSYSEVTKHLDTLLHDCPASVPRMRRLRPEDSKQIKKLFKRLEGPAFRGFERIAGDAFVDVDLP